MARSIFGKCIFAGRKCSANKVLVYRNNRACYCQLCLEPTTCCQEQSCLLQPALSWTKYLLSETIVLPAASYVLNQPPAVRNNRASCSQLCLEPSTCCQEQSCLLQPAMAWTNHLLSGTNVLPTASYALNQLYLLSELASGFTCSQTLAFGGWFRPENHTCLSLYIYICVQGYTQRYTKGWKVCGKPLRYEVSSMWWSTCEAYPEAYPRSKPRSIPPKHTP